MKKLIDFANLPKHITNHVCGEQHSIAHRRIVGFVVFMIGYTLTHAGGSIFIIQIITDNVDLYLHAAGLIPFIEPKGIN
jgi:hypothetical protein